MKIITIMPDFGMAPYAWVSDDGKEMRGIGGCMADAAGGFYDNEFNVSPELTARFADWARKFERDAYENPAFPWKEFHEEGLALTRRLKTGIGNRARVLYCRPTEDPHDESERCVEFLSIGSKTCIVPSPRRWRPGR